MPRLSLFKPEKGNDFKFTDRNVGEMFQIGGTDAYIHKYISPNDQGELNYATQPERIGDSLDGGRASAEGGVATRTRSGSLLAAGPQPLPPQRPDGESYANH